MVFGVTVSWRRPRFSPALSVWIIPGEELPGSLVHLNSGKKAPVSSLFAGIFRDGAILYGMASGSVSALGGIPA